MSKRSRREKRREGGSSNGTAQPARSRSVDRNPQQVNGLMLRQAAEWMIGERSFDELKFHGNTKWTAPSLIFLAVLWVWSDHDTLTGAFAQARDLALNLVGSVAVTTYQGLSNALVSATPQLLPLVWARMQGLMQQHGGEYYRVSGWVPLAVDGSRVSVPRTSKNEEALCAPNHGRSKSAKGKAKKRRKAGKVQRQKSVLPPKPQIWITKIWHMGLRLTWCWKTGPSNSSERAHFAELLETQTFPEKTLFCADAGFVGYDLWQRISNKKHHFLIRVGANVRLLRHLAYCREGHGVVYCWPDKAARKRQPPITLRLIEMRLGRTPIYLVTNVLDPELLSASDAKTMYELRWGIEVCQSDCTSSAGLYQLAV